MCCSSSYKNAEPLKMHTLVCRAIGGKIRCGISLKHLMTKYINKWKQDAYKYKSKHIPFPKCRWFHDFRNGHCNIILNNNENNIHAQKHKSSLIISTTSNAVRNPTQTTNPLHPNDANTQMTQDRTQTKIET